MRNAKFTKKNGSGNTNSCKTLTDLPDEVLQHILTKLPAKDAAKMSLLLKKFEDLWTSIDVLNIHQNQFKERSLFMNFVDRTLFYQDRSSIKVFHLSCDALSDASRLNAWISTVIRANVEVLWLSLLCLESGYKLPRYLFNSHSLTAFHLDMPCILNLPSSINFPCLKILRLGHVKFVDADSTQQLVSSPTLEELSMFKCVWTVSSITTHALKLQKLSIDESHYYDGFELSNSDTRVDIFCTRLKSFYYYGVVPMSMFAIYCSSSLVEVTIDLHDSLFSLRNVLHCERIVKILKGMRHVKNLTLTSDGIGALTFKPPGYLDLPMFGNVTNFKLNGGVIDFDAERGLIFVLSKLSHLTILELVDTVIDFLEPPEDSDINELILEPIPPCFRSHLKKIIFSYSIPDYCLYYDLLVLGAFLKANEVLEELIIHWPCKEEKDKKKALRHLQKLPQGSKHCKIILL